MTDRWFPALLKYWRGRRGLSQLDLALTAGVSARHVSYLESGRARPSEAMVLRLMAALGVALRDQDEALRAAGFAPRFADAGITQVSPAVSFAIERMLQQQEPYPLTLLSADFCIQRCNRAATRIFQRFIADPARWTAQLDMFTLLFDPALARPFVVGWADLAQRMLARLHREVLQSGGDERLSALLERTLRQPDVNPQWRRPDLAQPVGSTLEVWLRRDAVTLGFMTTITVFSAPQRVTLEELRIESYFPLDEATRHCCEQWAAEDDH